MKGRLRKARDVNRVVRILATREAIFEATAIDLGLHTEAGVLAYKQRLAQDTRAALANFPEPLRSKVATAVGSLDNMAPQLFIQALTTFELIHRVISHSILFFAQRRGKTLQRSPIGRIGWRSTPRAPLSAFRNARPCPCRSLARLISSTSLDRFRRKEIADDDSLDPARLLKDFTFKAGQEIGLEIVDVLANSTRRMLRGELQREGWINMHRLMIHRTETYIKFILFGPGPDVVQGADYAAIVNESFRKNGKPMFKRRNGGYEQKVQL